VDVRTGWGRGADSMYVSSVVIFISSGPAAIILQMQERSVGDHVVHLPGTCPHAIVAAPSRRGIGRMSSSPSLGRPLGLLLTALTNTFLRASVLILAVATAPVVISAQPAGRIYRLGLLSPEAPPPGLLEAFNEGLHDLGYIEGKNIHLESRHASGRSEQLAGLAAELVQLRVDVIVAINTSAALAARDATATIPIVITRVSNPVETGLVRSFAHPGGNITGLSFQPEETSVKRLQLLKQAVPSVARVAVLWDAVNPGPNLTVKVLEPASLQLGLQLLKLPVKEPTDLQSAVQMAARSHANALFVVDDVFVTSYRRQILEIATKHSLPVISQYRDFVELGGLLAYGPSIREMYRRTAHYVDRILRGSRPADLPIEQPTKYDLVVNLKTATMLGFNVPSTVLSQADEVIH